MSSLAQKEKENSLWAFQNLFKDWSKQEDREARAPKRGADPKEKLRLLGQREKLQFRLAMLVVDMIFLETVEGQQYHLGLALDACCRATSGPKIKEYPVLKKPGKVS